MTTAKTIKRASLKVSSTYPCVLEGKICFMDKSSLFILEDFKVPESIDNDDELNLYFNEILNDSGCDITTIGDIYVEEF